MRSKAKGGIRLDRQAASETHGYAPIFPAVQPYGSVREPNHWCAL